MISVGTKGPSDTSIKLTALKKAHRLHFASNFVPNSLRVAGLKYIPDRIYEGTGAAGMKSAESSAGSMIRSFIYS